MVAELLDEEKVLVEFGDDRGHAYSVVPRSELLILHCVP
jgi:hypothetical protein